MTTIPATRISLAGFGAWGQMHARALAAIAGAEIIAVYCHGDASAAAAAAALPGVPQFRDYAAMLAAAPADVVDVCVPNNRHAEFAVAALDAGRHVFLEKPLGVTLAQCDAVIAASRRAGRLVALNHELRVSHQWGAVREAIDRGDLGQVRYLNFSLFRHRFRQGSGGWRYDHAQVGSWVLEELVHFFDLVLWYMRENGPPRRVRAIGNGSSAASGLSENISAVVEFDGGAYATLTQCLSGFEHHTLLEVTGTAGAARSWWSGAMDRTLHPAFELKLQKAGAEAPTIVAIPSSGEVFELEENLRRALAGFAQGLSIMPAEEARQAIAVCLAAEAAIAGGGVVPVDG